MKKVIIIILAVFISNLAEAQTSLDYDGVNDYVATGFEGILGNNNRTVEFWFKTTDTGASGFVEWGTQAIAERFTVAVTMKKLRVGVYGSGKSGTTNINDNVWHHTAVVYNGTTATIYLDGVFEASGVFNSPLNTTSGTDVMIGRSNLSRLKALDGEIDEVRIWDTARTLGEIRDNMFHELTGSEANLVLYFSKELTTTGAYGVIDLTSANNGTMTNMDVTDIVTSYAAIRTTNTQTNTRGIWEATGTSNSLESDGFWMDVNSTLTEINYATFGHDNAGSSIVSNDIPATVVQRYEQIWHILQRGSVTSNITFDLSTIHGVAVTAGIVSGYRLLYRIGTSGIFTDLGPATSTTNIDQVTFSAVALSDGYYTIGTLNGSTSPLPIELISFNTIALKNNTVQLDWITASEINNDFFTVERSINGIEWEGVIRVVGVGNSSSVLNYSTNDNNPYSGTSYYRLKQTDFNGQFEYSQIRSLNIEKLGNSQIEMYPNPVNNQITITGSKTELKSIIIYNILGQDVTKLTNQISRNESKIIIDLSILNTGIYYIKTKTTANKVYKQ